MVGDDASADHGAQAGRSGSNVEEKMEYGGRPFRISLQRPGLGGGQPPGTGRVVVVNVALALSPLLGGSIFGTPGIRLPVWLHADSGRRRVDKDTRSTLTEPPTGEERCIGVWLQSCTGHFIRCNGAVWMNCVMGV